MTYTPIYKQIPQTNVQRLASRVACFLASKNVQDGSKLILGCVACSAGGWYAIPYLAMAI